MKSIKRFATSSQNRVPSEDDVKTSLVSTLYVVISIEFAPNIRLSLPPAFPLAIHH